MQHLEGSGTSVLYIGRWLLKVKPMLTFSNVYLYIQPPLGSLMCQLNSVILQS
jgi:hypothetical protein